ncbi:MAG: glutamine--fructose-6-phosphate transaminase (isomerizing) [Candidatus Bipolaricaulota bacterium]|nr:glutamine--fructose-6-phosphate transaminase (isomerizing) [Candidatus Bipolaricaulota bacterium]MDW8126349.1 glutamine--fructose-6-phosphate transaminase (isomerizing) [Candidatus Bipolaricaulota bacterium]
MCGIIGYVGPRGAQNILLSGLSRLEYRGYDSAGVAVLTPQGLFLLRRVGKLENLKQAVLESGISGNLGIGHTRWATHGLPTEENAHPHMDCTGKIALVHNGIIENHRELREKLLARGHLFRSQTDTETLVHLVEENYAGDLVEAVRRALAGARGAYAVAVIHAAHPQEIVVAREGSPLVVGILPGEGFLASDVPALLPYTRTFHFLEDGEIARITPGRLEIWDRQGNPKEPRFHDVPWDPLAAEKLGFRHFMEKEIHEQPRALADTLRSELSTPWEEGLCGLDLSQVEHIYLVACGTSYHAALVVEYLWEPLLQLPVTAEVASEFRYKGPAVGKNTLVVAVSQSGETIDTLMAVRGAKERGAQVIGVVNIVGSAIARESHAVFYTRAGLEIGVAATKTFSAQIAALALLGGWLARGRGLLSERELQELKEELSQAPRLVEEVLRREPTIENLAQKFYTFSNFLYLGRGLLYPLALEGALKLKEISYIHAEGYAAGEMKHGPIALIHEQMPVVVLYSRKELPDKTLANIQEAKARRGILLVFADEETPELRELSDHLLLLPQASRVLLPFTFSPALQLLAYHIARLRGTDVDQPRNLAKTVTVE